LRKRKRPQYRFEGGVELLIAEWGRANRKKTKGGEEYERKEGSHKVSSRDEPAFAEERERGR